MEPSPPSVSDYGVTKSRCIMMLRSWACFDTWFFVGDIWNENAPTIMVTGCNRIFETLSQLVEASSYPKYMSNQSFN